MYAKNFHFYFFSPSAFTPFTENILILKIGRGGEMDAWLFFFRISLFYSDECLKRRSWRSFWVRGEQFQSDTNIGKFYFLWTDWIITLKKNSHSKFWRGMHIPSNGYIKALFLFNPFNLLFASLSFYSILQGTVY